MPIASTNYGKIARVYNGMTTLLSLGRNRPLQCWFLNRIRSDDRVLSIGCETVDFNGDLLAHPPDVTFLDISPSVLDTLKRRLPNKGGTYVCMDVIDFAPNTHFNAVLLGFVLNTFSRRDSELVIRHVIDLTSPGGIICVADESVAESLLHRAAQLLLRWPVYLFHALVVGQPLHSVYCYDDIVARLGWTVSERHRATGGDLQAVIYEEAT